MTSWFDLADDEIRARLEHHGVDPEHAYDLTRHRDTAEASAVITEILDGGF